MRRTKRRRSRKRRRRSRRRKRGTRRREEGEKMILRASLGALKDNAFLNAAFFAWPLFGPAVVDSKVPLMGSWARRVLPKGSRAHQPGRWGLALAGYRLPPIQFRAHVLRPLRGSLRSHFGSRCLFWGLPAPRRHRIALFRAELSPRAICRFCSNFACRLLRVPPRRHSGGAPNCINFR